MTRGFSFTGHALFLTKDGGLAAHFEHTVVITDDEPEVLTPPLNSAGNCLL